MPRQGGQGKGKPKKGDRGFGRALIKQQANGARGYLGTKASSDTKNLSSILENNALDDFINMVEMDDEDVDVNRYDNDEHPIIVVDAANDRVQSLSTLHFSQDQLTIPRKPRWTHEMSANDVDHNERMSFLEWRRSIADIENNCRTSEKITPYEKNLEVWRQLWRVCERSNLVVQVVDARNPLLFFTSDLRNYLSEMSTPREMILVINKSDLLSDQQRLAWSSYFTTIGVKHLFYSAFFEQEKLDEDRSSSLDSTELKSWAESLLSDVSPSLPTSVVRSREELLLAFELFSNLISRSDPSRPFCIGMVGYPNVGKSSCINTLLGVTKSNHGKIRVGVSATPGKTKHFQTIPLSKSIMLCDCPGLVFPSFMRSTAEMLCSGILPINQMRDCIEPTNIICSRIPKHLLEATYGIHINRELDVLDNPHRPPTGTEFLAAYCKVKTYITSGTGRWDDFRASKEILRDFNDGRLLFVAQPPASIIPLDDWLRQTESTLLQRSNVAERVLKQRMESANTVELDVQGLEDPQESSVVVDQEYEFVMEEEHYQPDDELQATAEKREHKRLKHWGKKNRKLRDKNPYDEEYGAANFVATIRNRGPNSYAIPSHPYNKISDK